MKNIYRLLPFFLLIVSQLAIAQCPPPGFPQPGNTCPQAPILCENLDGYCATVNNNNVQQNFPGCPFNVLNNDEWFAFYAGTTQISIQVTPSNCTQSGQMGLQGGIYAGCGPPWNAMDLQCSCTENPFILESSNFVVGQIYWIVLDGCAGNVCDYSIDVISGSTVGQPPADPGPITGLDTVCQNTSNTYSIAPPTGATIYNWTITPALGTTSSTTQNASISWGNTAGTAQVCVSVANACYSNPVQSCTTVVVQPVPTATISGTGDICANSTGSVDLTVTFTGQGPWTFVYTIGGSPQPAITTNDNPYTLVVTQPGNYALQSVSSVSGNCPGTVSGSAAITETVLTQSADITDATCSLSNGSIDLTPGGGASPYTFNWSNSATTEDISDVPPGTYQVTVTDANGCSKIFDYTVGDQPNEPSISSTTTPSICGESDGDINISVSGGDSPYTFNWSNGETTEDLTDVPAGSYTVTVTGADGCTQTATITLANNDPPITVNANIVANTTCNGGNGSITTTVNPNPAPGGGTYTYNWSNGETTPNLPDLTPGSYTVTVSTGTSCSQVTTFTIPDEPNEPNANLTPTPSECGQANGEIDLTVSGGVSPYTFNWSNGETTEDISGVPAGSYTVTVTGANGCTTTATTSISNNDPPITVNANVVANTTCNGGNGSITTTVSPTPAPGGGTYTYNWSNGATTPNLTDLTPGTYTVTVTAVGNCTQVASFTIPDQPNQPNISPNVTPATCGLSNGSIGITVSGGVTPYTFNWSNGTTTEDLSNIPAGTYTVTVTGANGCSSTASIPVPDNPVLFTVSTNVNPNTSCDGNNDGSITANVSPPGNYTYTWSNGSTTNSLTDLAPGTYTVTVSAGGNCTQVVNVPVPNQPNVPVLSPNTIPSTCGLSNGTASITASGGVPNFTYIWSNGSTANNITNVPAGSYTVTVTGANGCSSVSTVNIANNNPPITVTANVTGNTSCISGNGAIDVSVAPNGPTYTYQWSNGATSQDLTNLNPGTYTVTVSAGGSCSQTASFTVPDDSQAPVLTPNVTQSVCGLPNGAINLSVSGGITPYTIVWSNGATSTDLTGLTPGGYAVTVTTATGCSTALSITVPSNDVQVTLNGNAFPNTACNLPFNGQIVLDVQPPFPPQGTGYSFIWSNGATTQSLNQVEPGTYFVTVSAGPACTQVASFTVPNFAAPPELSTAVTAATCGQQNGMVDLTVEYGTSPFFYTWSNSSFSQDLTNVAPGTYFVTVTDAANCTATASATVVNNNLALNISGTPAANTSCQSPNGAIDVTVSPAGTYNFQWSNSATTEDLSGLAAGTYAVTVTAGGNCSATATFTVANQTSQPQISESITAAICGESNGAIDLSITGATPPYSFAWSNSATTEDLANLPPGDYSVTVSGVNGCSASATFNVPNNSSNFTLNGTAQPINTCVFDNGQINLTITPSGTYDIVWSNGETTEDLDSLSVGTYSVTVTESGACSASASFTITDQTSAPATSQTITAEICGQMDGAVDLTVTGTSTPFSFLWSNNATSEDLTGVAAGTYTVTVTGGNGCSTMATANVPDNSVSLSVNGTTLPNTSCDVNNGSINVTVTPSGTYSYSWSNSATTEDISGLAGGSYTVTVSAGGNCTAEASFTVGSTTLDPVISQNITPAICGESNGAINLTVSGGQSPFSFLWSNTATTEDLANLAPGSYTVTVTGGNGCVANASFTVPDNSVNFAVNGQPAANTSCDNPNGSIDVTVTPSGTYDFIWSNSATSEDIGALAPGTYTVTVTQGLNCTTVGNFTVGNNTNAPNFTQIITPATCGSDNGSIDLSPSGGTAPYQILWSNSETTEDLSGLTAGNYGVTVTGADGCANTGNFTVPDDLVSLDIAGTATQNTACTGGNGTVDITVTPAGNYTYTWSDGSMTEDLGGLAGGSYEVTVSAGGTCTAVASFNVPDNPDLPVLTSSVTASICGAPDGGIDITVSGGETPYQFTWSNGATTEDLSGIVSGDYDVIVTAANGCFVTADFSVPNNSNTFDFSGVAQANTLCGSGNGSIDLTVTPAGNYNFSWSNSETTEDLGGLAPGTYQVTVSDGGSCTASASFTVANNAPTVNVAGTVTDVLCFGGDDGAIDLVVDGGVAPYTFEWTPDLADPTMLAAGSYTVVATDASGCTGSADFTIGQPAGAVQLACTQSGNVTLPGGSDGQGSVNISGGTAPYSVSWTPGGSAPGVPAGIFTIDNLSEGDYNVAVTDANGCPAACDFTISQDGCVSAVGTMESGPLTACGEGCLTAVYDSTGQYLDPDDVLQFILHEGNNNLIVNEIARSNQPDFCFDPALMSYGVAYYVSAAVGNDDGAGNVILTDDCTVVSIGTQLIFYEIPVADAAQPEPLTCLVSQVTLTGNSTVAGSTFSWSTNGGSIIGNPNQASVQADDGGFYTLIVTANGCSDTVTVEVTDLNTDVEAGITSSPGEVLDCTISEITLIGSASGTSDAVFNWFLNGNPAGDGNQLLVGSGGTYQLIVTDSVSGCSDSETISIDDNTDFPPLFTDPAPVLNCLDTVVTISGGSTINGVQFSWATISGADTTIIGAGQNVPVNQPGTYYLIGTAPNDCVNAVPVVVTGDFTAPTANAGPDQTLDCYQTPVDLTGSGSPGVTFFWTVDDPGIVISNPASPSISADEEGVYTLTVTSLGNYCTDSDDVEVFQYENVPQGLVTAEPPNCFGDENGIIVVESDPANGPYQYQLNGQNYGGTNVFAPLAPGIYQLQVVDGQGCVWTTEVFLAEPAPLVADLGTDVIVELGESVTLQVFYTVPVSQLDTILWTPTELFPCDAMPCDVQEFFPTGQTSVGVTVVDTNGCQASDLVSVFVSKDRQIYVPNAFSPNGDGINDVFTVFAGKDVVEIKSFLVFSRWGETVYEYFNFEPNNPAYGWDGTHRGEVMNPAVFAWFAEIEFTDGEVILFEGDVSLMR